MPHVRFMRGTARHESNALAPATADAERSTPLHEEADRHDDYCKQYRNLDPVCQRHSCPTVLGVATRIRLLQRRRVVSQQMTRSVVRVGDFQIREPGKGNGNIAVPAYEMSRQRPNSLVLTLAKSGGNIWIRFMRYYPRATGEQIYEVTSPVS